MESIHSFFAVTATSLYLVSDSGGEAGRPVLEKIALREGAESRIPIGGRLERDWLVGITKDGIILYGEDHPRPGRTQDPKEVNIAFQDGRTSPITALFLDKEKAMACLNSPDLQECDLRWREQTEETLKAIGDNHSVFILSKYAPISFE